MPLPPIISQETISVSSPAFEGLQHGELLVGRVTRVGADGTSLLSFPGWKALAQSSLSFHPGDRIIACIQKTAGQTKILLLPELKLADELSATVISSRQVLIRWGDLELRAQLHVDGPPPEVGSLAHGRIQLQSGRPIFHATSSTQIESGPPILLVQVYQEMLRLPGNEGLALQKHVQALLSLVQNLPKQRLIDWPWLNPILKNLENALINPQAEEIAEQLMASARDSGVFFESKLATAAQANTPDHPARNDLKMALLQMIQKFSGSVADKEAQSSLQAQLVEKATRLLDSVRGEQLINLRLLPSRQLYFQLPMASSSGLSGLEILISPQKEKKGTRIDSRNIILTIAVSTSHLGKIRAGIFICNGRMTCQFKASNRQALELIEKNSESLKKGLQRLSYEVVHIGCATVTDDRQLSLGAALPLGELNGVNISA
jgi:hypothetical protein